MDVADWLHGLGLGQYEEAFRANDIDAEVLLDLTAEDLVGLGITSIGHRRKLLSAVAALRQSSVPDNASFTAAGAQSLAQCCLSPKLSAASSQ